MAVKKTKKKAVAVKKAAKKKPAEKAKAARTVKKTVSSKKPAAKARVKLSLRERKLNMLKEELSRQKEALLSEAENAINTLPDQGVFPDLGDQATAETDRSFMLRLRGRDQRLLKKIEEAVERMDNGIFGICEVCGNAIELKRLEARPVTTMCIECKTEQEEEEKLKRV